MSQLDEIGEAALSNLMSGAGLGACLFFVAALAAPFLLV